MIRLSTHIHNKSAKNSVVSAAIAARAAEGRKGLHGRLTSATSLAQLGSAGCGSGLARSVVIVVVDYIFLIHLETTTALCVPQKSRLKVEKRRRKKGYVYITSQFPFAIFHVAKFTKGLAKRNFITFYDFIV